jgi:SAM-dependent methyltransferase
VVDADLAYVRRLLADDVLRGPVLELGTGYGGQTARSEVEAAKLQYFGTDVHPGEGVDFAADFERSEDMAVFAGVAPFGSVLILNVLEHTFDPLRILDNAATLVRPGGTLVTITPSVWPLHNYPLDAYRLLPNFFEEYAKRRRRTLLTQYFEYVGYGPVAKYRNDDGSYIYPPPAPPGMRYQMNRVIHRVFNTFGRGMFQPSHIAIGAVFQI